MHRHKFYNLVHNTFPKKAIIILYLSAILSVSKKIINFTKKLLTSQYYRDIMIPINIKEDSNEKIINCSGYAKGFC